MEGIAQRKDECRDARRVHWLQDARYSFRILARTPGFMIVTAMVLPLGIGANSLPARNGRSRF